MKLRKILIKIGVVLLIAVAAALVIRTVFNYVEGRKLTRTVAGLKGRGVPVTAADLAAPCPDEDNAARLWKAAENMTTFEKKADRGPGLPPRPHPPALESFSRAWQDYAAGKPIAPADRSVLKDLILENQKVFELLAEMGQKPCFLYRDPGQTLLAARLPSAVQMLRITKLQLFSALFSAEEGDVVTAVGKIGTGLRFAPLAAQEGSLISYLIAVSESRMLAFFLGDMFRGRPIGDEALLRLIDELDPGPWPARLAGAVRGERVAFIEAGDYVLRGSLKEELEFLHGEPSLLKSVGAWLIRPLLKRDIRGALPVYDELEAQARRPYYESRGFFGSRGRELMKRPWYAFLSKAMIANFEAAFMKEALVEATFLASRTGLACRLYKIRTGRYPESLEALVPGILKEVPIDPFTGKALVYRRDGEGFIVYSLGTNEKDDGGRSTFNVSRLVMDKDDDLSWREDR
jgi:hypothetical protein